MSSITGQHDFEFAPQGANYGDSSGALFSMYLTRAEKFDKEQSESWKANADGILVFVRASTYLSRCKYLTPGCTLRPVCFPQQ
jgi:hypothetical protein